MGRRREPPRTICYNIQMRTRRRFSPVATADFSTERLLSFRLRSVCSARVFSRHTAHSVDCKPQTASSKRATRRRRPPRASSIRRPSKRHEPPRAHARANPSVYETACVPRSVAHHFLSWSLLAAYGCLQRAQHAKARARERVRAVASVARPAATASSNSNQSKRRCRLDPSAGCLDLALACATHTVIHSHSHTAR